MSKIACPSIGNFNDLNFYFSYRVNVTILSRYERPEPGEVVKKKTGSYLSQELVGMKLLV